MPWEKVTERICFLKSALSLMCSAIISVAPARASSAEVTPFSSFINSLAYSSGVPLWSFWSKILVARGSRPFSLAMEALVFLWLNNKKSRQMEDYLLLISFELILIAIFILIFA